MEILLGVIIAITGILAVFVLRSLTTLFHELGHAIPALLFTRGEVIVYIGTYGDVSNSYHIKLNRLAIYFRLNFLDWKIGMCTHDGTDNNWKNLIILFGGPIASLLIAVPLMIWVINGELSEVQMGAILVFSLAAVIDFVVNLIPFGNGFQMHDGTINFSDGTKMVYLFGRFFVTQEFLELEKKWESKAYEEVINDSKKLLDSGSDDKWVFDILIEAYMETRQYQEALNAYQEYQANFKMRYEDYATIGELYMRTNQYQEALKYFNYCLSKNFNDAVLLGYRAKVFSEQGDYEEAEKDFAAALNYFPGNSKLHLERSLVKVKLEKYNEAWEDILTVENMDKEKPFLAYCKGIFYEARGDLEKALDNLKLARQLNYENHRLEYKIEMMDQELKTKS